MIGDYKEEMMIEETDLRLGFQTLCLVSHTR